MERDILEAMAAEVDPYLSELAEFVALDTPSDDPQAVGRLLDLLAPRLADLGATVRRPQADVLDAGFGATDAGHVLLLLHADTVFGHGEAARRPLRVDGGRAYGPGVADMKGGIALMLWVLRLATRAGRRAAGLRVLVTGDEETGAERSAQQIERAAAGARAALVLEPGRESGAVVSARKAVGSFRLEAAGIEAHAGVEPWRGASAVHELARRVAAIADLSERIPGLHVNVGRIEGGTRANVVAGAANCLIDVRVLRQRDMAAAQELLAEAALAAADPKVALRLLGGFTGPPMEKTAATELLLAHARAAAQAIALPLEDVATGGGSDGNRVAAQGVPVLDGLGPVGGRAHSDDEFLEIASVAPRAALLAGILVRLGAFGPI